MMIYKKGTVCTSEVASYADNRWPRQVISLPQQRREGRMSV